MLNNSSNIFILARVSQPLNSLFLAWEGGVPPQPIYSSVDLSDSAAVSKPIFKISQGHCRMVNGKSVTKDQYNEATVVVMKEHTCDWEVSKFNIVFEKIVNSTDRK